MRGVQPGLTCESIRSRRRSWDGPVVAKGEHVDIVECVDTTRMQLNKSLHAVASLTDRRIGQRLKSDKQGLPRL